MGELQKQIARNFELQDKIKKYKFWFWVLFAMLILMLVSGIRLYSELQERELQLAGANYMYDMVVKENRRLQRIEMYAFGGRLNKTSFVNGLYWHDKFFCVWTQGRDWAQVKNTIVHENTHDAVYDFPDHFCHNLTPIVDEPGEPAETYNVTLKIWLE